MGIGRVRGADALETFEEFVAARGDALLRTAWVLTGDLDEAEDLVQSALTKTWARFERIQAADGNYEAYVRRTLLTTQMSVWRRRRMERAKRPSLPGTTPGAVAVDYESRSVLFDALAQLSRRQRSVIVLRFYEDLSERETASVLGCSVGAVKSHQHRALTTLRRTPLLHCLTTKDSRQ